jgi:glyoxylase-like metal-dependent hydrolase (beta-lactamase superfamily II)
VFTPVLLEAQNPGPMTGRGNNTYLIPGVRGSAVLVDAGVGHPNHLRAIDAALDARHAHLRQVLVTHGHADLGKTTTGRWPGRTSANATRLRWTTSG